MYVCTAACGGILTADTTHGEHVNGPLAEGHGFSSSPEELLYERLFRFQSDGSTTNKSGMNRNKPRLEYRNDRFFIIFELEISTPTFYDKVHRLFS